MHLKLIISFLKPSAKNKMLLRLFSVVLCLKKCKLEEESGYRKEFGCGGALRLAANSILALIKSLHVKITGYVAKSLGIHHHPIMTHTFRGRCVRQGGASMFNAFWLNYQVGLQSTDFFAPPPFLKIYVSNMPQKHLNLSIPYPQNYSQS